MRRCGIAVAVLCLAAVAPSPADARPRKCAGVEYSAGNGYYFYAATRIRGTRVTCSLARRVAHFDAAKVSGHAPRLRRLGFSCHGRRKSAATVSFVCRRQRARITFAWTEK